MAETARVGSFDAVRDFLAAFQTFAHEAEDAVSCFDLEIQRSLAELTEAEPAYWRQELRRAEDEVSQARIELQRAQYQTLPGGQPKSTIDERKQLERARAKHQFIEEKQQVVRKWAGVASRAIDEYSGRATQLNSLFAAEHARGVQMLNRVLDSLTAYADGSFASGSAPTAIPASETSDTEN